MDVGLRLLETNKGKPCILYHSYKFRKYRELMCGEIFWRCCFRKCSSSMKTNAAITEVLDEQLNHSHDAPPPDCVQRQILRGACKRKATEDPTTKPNKIIHRELMASLDRSDGIGYEAVKSSRSAIYRERRKTFPILPKSRKEAVAQVRAMEIYTCKSELFTFACEETEIIIVTCATNLTALCTSVSDVFGDGTFTYCPKYFAQMYTIHGFKNGYYVPLVYCFLPSKTTECYLDMWKMVGKLCTSIANANFNPQVFHLDFEAGAMTAVKRSFPDCTIKGCRFHLLQSFYRKINCGRYLREEYSKQDSETGRWLKLFFGLPFLPAEEVSDAFCEIYANAPANAPATVFADYVLENYVDEDARFPPEIWAEQPSSSPHTTNGPEAFHRHFNSQFYHPHPPIFSVIEILKELQAETYLKMEVVQKNGSAPVRKTEKERLKFTSDMWSKYKNFEFTRLKYLLVMGHRFKN